MKFPYNKAIPVGKSRQADFHFFRVVALAPLPRHPWFRLRSSCAENVPLPRPFGVVVSKQFVLDFLTASRCDLLGYPQSEKMISSVPSLCWINRWPGTPIGNSNLQIQRPGLGRSSRSVPLENQGSRRKWLQNVVGLNHLTSR